MFAFSVFASNMGVPGDTWSCLGLPWSYLGLPPATDVPGSHDSSGLSGPKGDVWGCLPQRTLLWSVAPGAERGLLGLPVASCGDRSACNETNVYEKAIRKQYTRTAWGERVASNAGQSFVDRYSGAYLYFSFVEDVTDSLC